MNGLRGLWERLARLWRATPCERCGAPSVGFVTRVDGRLHTRDSAGKPVTKMYVSGAVSMCRACMDKDGRDAAARRGADETF